MLQRKILYKYYLKHSYLHDELQINDEIKLYTSFTFRISKESGRTHELVLLVVSPVHDHPSFIDQLSDSGFLYLNLSTPFTFIFTEVTRSGTVMNNSLLL